MLYKMLGTFGKVIEATKNIVRFLGIATQASKVVGSRLTRPGCV